MNLTKIYAGKSVEMLTAAEVIVMQALADKSTLVSVQSGWANSYLEDLRDRIKDAQRLLGKDVRHKQKQLTKQVLEMMSMGLLRFDQLKVSVGSCYKDRPFRKAVLADLGYSYSFRSRKGDQESLVQWLQVFVANISVYEPDLLASGLDPGVLADLKLYANDFAKLNSEQETEKGLAKKATLERQQEFNEVYDAVIIVASFAKTLFDKDRMELENYMYTRILARMNAPKSNSNGGGAGTLAA